MRKNIRTVLDVLAVLVLLLVPIPVAQNAAPSVEQQFAQALKQAGLPQDPSQIVGRTFSFVYMHEPGGNEPSARGVTWGKIISVEYYTGVWAGLYLKFDTHLPDGTASVHYHPETKEWSTWNGIYGQLKLR